MSKSTGEFSVCQFFTDGSYEYVRRDVSADEAMVAVEHYTNNIATMFGIVARVIITDGGDCVVYEWTKGGGVIFPPPEDIQKCS